MNVKTILQGHRLKSAGGGKWHRTPILSTTEFYRDPGTNIRGAQGQTVGSAKAMRGGLASVGKMRKAAAKVR
jgi:hypothetical protein